MNKRSVILYKSNSNVKQSVAFSDKDYALASLYLDISILELKEFTSKVEEFSTYKARNLIKVKQLTVLDAENVFQKFEDSTFLFYTKRMDWMTLMFLYVIDVSQNPLEGINELVPFCKKKIEFFRKTQDFFKEQRIAYRKLQLELAYDYHLFNFLKLKRVCREHKVQLKSLPEKELVVFTWEDITIGDDKSGYIKYPRISLVTDYNFIITRYLLGFTEFYYDSSWGALTFPLHPNIHAELFEYGRNHHLEFINRKDYNMVVNVFSELVKEYHEYSFVQPIQLSQTYRRLKAIWQKMNPDLKYKTRSIKLFEKILKD